MNRSLQSLGWIAALSAGVALCLAQQPNEAEALISQGHYREALQQLQQSGADSAGARYLESRAWDGLGDPVRAAEAAQAAIDLNPQNTVYRLHLGQLLLTHDNARDALQVFTDALEIEPDNTVLQLGRGLALNQLHRYDEAAPVFESCLQSDPSMGLALDGLMEAHLQRGRFQDAENAARGYLADNPDKFRGYYYVALAKDKQGAAAEELEPLLRKALERNGRFAPAHALLGKALLDAGRNQEAILSLEGAVRLDPDYSLSRINLARAYRAVGRDEDARAQAEALKALQRKRDAVMPALRRADDPE